MTILHASAYDNSNALSPEPRLMTLGPKSSNILYNLAGIPPTPALSVESLEDSDGHSDQPKAIKSELLSKFLSSQVQLKGLKTGSSSVVVDGQNLSIPQITAVARYRAAVGLDSGEHLRLKVDKSRQIIDEKIAYGTSIYGLSTGFGGSADTRTKDHEALGMALLQHQHIGVLPTFLSSPSDNSNSEANNEPAPLPLFDPLNSLSIPPSWVRAAILVRVNSLVRGHSAVSWSMVETMTDLLTKNVTPVVPLRSTISASGDLSPLSYVASTLIGEKHIYAYTDAPSVGSILPAHEALKKAGITPITLKPKEHLGILNGTAFSAGLAALVVDEAAHLALLANVCTAMGTEALLGSRASHAPFIHETCRPHPGQVESARLILSLLSGSRLAGREHERELTVEEDVGMLRQDRYPLRTSPQFLGPQMEDILSAWETVTIECNSTTDNPLVDPESGNIYHAGNFQALAISNAMEKTRLALHLIGKLIFSQSTEILNPAFNWGLPPSVAATDPSLNYHCKGLDIATASYVSELGWLANPVTTHIQSAEMHNQAVNSLAFISARATMQSLDVLKLLTASYLYILCQALDLRAMQADFQTQVDTIISDDLRTLFSSDQEELLEVDHKSLWNNIRSSFHASVESLSSMDAPLRMRTAAQTSSTPLLHFLASSSAFSSQVPLSKVTAFQSALGEKATTCLQTLRKEYLTGQKGSTPASQWLGKTKYVYEYIRQDLGVKMHGLDNLELFKDGVASESTVGQNISKIYEAIRDGKMQDIVAGIF